MPRPDSHCSQRTLRNRGAASRADHSACRIAAAEIASGPPGGRKKVLELVDEEIDDVVIVENHFSSNDG